MSTIPTISEEDILDFVDEGSFQRGKGYFRQHAIFNPRRHGMTLKASCYGSQAYAYQVEVTFDAEGIADAICSCPVGMWCKHTVALLLTWIHQPEDFLEQQDINIVLEQRSKAELIALIKKMLKREPELEMLLYTAGKQQGPINLDAYSHRIASIFQQYDNYEWGVTSQIISDLSNIQDTADELAAQGDYAGAIAIYELLVTAVLRQADTYDDEEGDLSLFITECINELATYLEKIPDDKALREQILQTLFAAYRYDVKAGGIGMAEDAPDLLLQHATAEERKTIAAWVNAAIAQANAEQGSTYHSNWAQQHFGGFLLELKADALDDETFLRICRETGRTADLVDRLLTLGRIDEALRESEPVHEYDLMSLADLFVKHGHDQLGEQLVEARSKRSQDSRLLEWLKRYYLAHDNYAAALELAEQLFRTRPDLTGYQEIRQLAQKLDLWSARRPKLMSFLNDAKNTYLLIQIALDEGEIDKAIAMVEAEQQQNYRYGYIYTGVPILVPEVAKAAEETRPHAAIKIYQQEAEKLINARGRENYQTACNYLTRVRALYEKLNESDQWTSYITALRDRSRGLRALKEELASAGL
ncbi:MAG: glyoxalase [Ktedonobacteraceae bacterium]